MIKEEILKKLSLLISKLQNEEIKIEPMRIYLTNGLTKEDYETYYGKQDNLEFIQVGKIKIKGEL